MMSFISAPPYIPPQPQTVPDWGRSLASYSSSTWGWLINPAVNVNGVVITWFHKTGTSDGVNATQRIAFPPLGGTPAQGDRGPLPPGELLMMVGQRLPPGYGLGAYVGTGSGGNITVGFEVQP